MTLFLRSIICELSVARACLSFGGGRCACFITLMAMEVLQSIQVEAVEWNGTAHSDLQNAACFMG